MVGTEVVNFGTCCSCGGTDSVRNVMCLNKRSPYGFGWGCMQCGLPAEGAIAVICDECLEAEAPIREVIKGEAFKGERFPYEETAGWEEFEHDLSQHPEIQHPDDMNARWEDIVGDALGDDLDADPVVLYDPETGPITDSQLTQIVDKVHQQAQRGELPPYWRNEQSGRLQPAIEALINHGAQPDKFSPPTPLQLGLVIQYFQLYINAPCWEGSELAELRKAAQNLRTVADCDRWLMQCLDLGIDPL